MTIRFYFPSVWMQYTGLLCFSLPVCMPLPMKSSNAPGIAPHATWLAETIRLSEERWGSYEDSHIVRRIRHEPHAPEAAIVARNVALAEREGLDDTARRWRDNAMLVAVALACLAIASGAAAGLAALGDGSRPVNLFWALGSLLGVHFLMLLLWAVGLAWGAKLGSTAGRLVLAGTARLSRIPGLAAAGQKAIRPPAEALVPRALLGLLQRAGMLRWMFGALSHAWWLLAILSALVTLIAMLSTRRYGFVWETTLLSPDTFVALTHALGWLPSLIGFETPDTTLVRASDGLQPLPAHAQAVWSSWLLGCVVVYGVLPRLVLFGICTLLVRWRRRRFSLDLSQPGLAVLRERLAPSSERLGVTQPAPMSLDGTGGPASTFAGPGSAPVGTLAPGFLSHPDPAHAPVMVGIELPDPTMWPPADAPAHAIDAGNLDNRQQRNALLDQFTRQPPPRLLVVCDAVQTPDRGTIGLIAELVQLAQQARVWLHGDADRARIDQWTQRLVAAGVPGQVLDRDAHLALGWLADEHAGEPHA